MNSDVSLISTHPFIRKFISNIIFNLGYAKISESGKYVVYSDMVPRVSRRVVEKSMMPVVPLPEKKFEIIEKSVEDDINELEVVAPETKKESAVSSDAEIGRTETKKEMTKLAQPIVQPRHIMSAPLRAIPPPIPKRKFEYPIDMVPPSLDDGNLSRDYGKITPFLQDPSVSLIECQGAGKPINIIRTGQRQITRIVLSEDDINEFLGHVSQEAHIPLLEGVFRSAVDNFSVNAVISKMIGSKFVVKKHSAYELIG